MNLLDNIGYVIGDGRTVLVGFPDELPTGPVFLIHGELKFALEPCTVLDIATRSGTYEYLSPFANFDVSVRRGNEEIPTDSCQISVNGLIDWYVDGHDTLQIELKRKYAPFLVTFPETLEVETYGEPVVFRAQAAGHRINAILCVEFTNLDTAFTSIARVRLDGDYIGGKNSVDYQSITVPVPPEMRRVSAQVSINYLGTTDPTSTSEPFVFLYDVCFQAASDEADELRALGDKALMYKWMKTSTKMECSTLELLFLEQAERVAVLQTDAVSRARAMFDERYYAAKNPELKFSNIDEYSHYLMQGWKEYRNPGVDFSVREYLLRHPDVQISAEEPLMHYANIGYMNSYSLGVFSEKMSEIWRDAGKEIPTLPETTILARAQDLMVPMNLIDAKKIAVFVVPEHNAMSGGIYSMFSIASQARRTRLQHGFEVLVMTRPNSQGVTYLRNAAFQNSETVLRFEQLRLFSEVEELQLHIPEYATVAFVRSLSPEMMHYLLSRDHVHVNILNQNTRLMPEPSKFRDLRHFANSIGQSVSHHAFFGQQFADHYALPSLLLPAYTDLSHYPPRCFEEKENLIIYSDDEAPYRRAVLEQLKMLDGYRLVKIKDITFDTYMDLATRCRFSVSFGEGFDGYVAQPIYQGGIGLALYTNEFFPDPSYKSFENFFETEEEMIANIVPTILRLEKDRKRYVALNSSLRAKWDELYNIEDYHKRIAKLIAKDYEILPAATT
ncbi:hypothetical protein C8J35_1601 [Rhizobium sp. PP-F2F-G38]|nr:hypothetical protein C8J35_1601 [Rhizobium sp. PP-F2F-G38]